MLPRGWTVSVDLSVTVVNEIRDEDHAMDPSARPADRRARNTSTTDPKTVAVPAASSIDRSPGKGR
jgi:hypothetical protein